MNPSEPYSDNQKSFRFLALALFFVFSFLPGVHAQTGNQQSGNPDSNLASVQVIDSQEVDLGQRSILYNRIVPPELKPESAFGVIAPEPAAPAPTAEELAEARRWDSLRQVTLSLSCTAIEGTGLTELRWRDSGKEMVAWSTLDFSYLAPLLDLSTETTAYSLMFTVQEATSTEIEAGNAEVQRRSLPSSLLISVPKLREEENGGVRRSSFQFASPDPVPAEIRQTMADLHLYVDAHREQLDLQHQEREAVRLAQEKELRDNPPQPRDTVIQYFPIRNQPTTGSGTNQ